MAKGQTKVLADKVLVALCSIDVLYSGWLDDEAFWMNPKGFLEKQQQLVPKDFDYSKLDLPPMGDVERSYFRSLTQGVKI